MKLKRNFSLFIAIVMILCSIPNNANAEGKDNKYNSENDTVINKGIHNKKFIKGASIDKGSNKVINSLDYTIDDIHIKFENATAYLTFSLDKKLNLDYELDLYPGSVSFGNNNSSIIGISKTISNGYKIVSFRIENNADTITLMNPNLGFANKTVISIGISRDNSSDIIYFQDVIENIDYNLLQNRAFANFNNSNLSYEDLIEVEKSYLFCASDMNSEKELTSNLTVDLPNNELNNITQEVTSEAGNSMEILDELFSGNYTYGSNNYIVNNENYRDSNISPLNLIPNIPDAIFTTSKTKDTIFTGNYNNERLFSYIQFNYVGTQNLETDIVVLDWIHNYNTTTGAVNQLSISYNTSVVYNVTTKALGIAPVPTAYFKITNAMITTQFPNPSTSGCFISLENQETSSGINFSLGSLIEATLKWVPQAKTILWAKSTLQSMASSKTATKLFFWPTPEQQYTYYGASMIQIKGTNSNNLKKVGDNIFIAGATNSSNPGLTYSYSYTAAKN